MCIARTERNLKDAHACFSFDENVFIPENMFFNKDSRFYRRVRVVTKYSASKAFFLFLVQALA